MKIIALYLPQFHRIPENDEWWGEGFTEWVNVKKAKSLYDGHRQPRTPLNNNYYNLLDVNVIRWQTELAKEHGLYGFCFYHYWFDGKLLLEKPVELFLNDKSIDFHYCLSWANEHWTNQWVSIDHKVLIEQRYGSKKEWKEHFDYLLPFFQDERYIKIDGKPVFSFFRPELIDCRKEMIDYWNELAIDAGFSGICAVFQRTDILYSTKNPDLSMFDYCVEYQPTSAWIRDLAKRQHFQLLRKVKKNVGTFIEKRFKISAAGIRITPRTGLTFFDYDQIWNHILYDKQVFPRLIPTAFVDWDNTPRRGTEGWVIKGSTPEKFKKYMTLLIKKAREEYSTDFMFIFAWNEWAEGGYLEPDTENEYKYLEAIESALKKCNEWEL